MPWELPQELTDRVQRARRLLAESEAHAGSADLQASSVERILQLGRVPCLRLCTFTNWGWRCGQRDILVW